jgi:hypothetical protein
MNVAGAIATPKIPRKGASNQVVLHYSRWQTFAQARIAVNIAEE